MEIRKFALKELKTTVYALRQLMRGNFKIVSSHGSEVVAELTDFAKNSPFL